VRQLNDNCPAQFVISLEKNDKVLFWKSVLVAGTHLKTNEWTRMHCTYDLPENLGKDEALKVYFWNTSPLIVEADDFEIRLYY